MSLSKVLILLLISSVGYSSFLPNSFKVQLTEKAMKIGKKKSKHVVGSFNYKYPSQVRYENEQMTFVSNKTNSWRYVPPFIPGEKGEVYVSKKNRNVIAKLFDVLRNGLKDNSVYKVKKHGAQNYFLDFTKAGAKDYNIKSVILSFNSTKLNFADLEKMSLTYADGKLVDLFLNSMNSAVSFDDSFFVFKAPANTKTINQ